MSIDSLKKEVAILSKTLAINRSDSKDSLILFDGVSVPLSVGIQRLIEISREEKQL